MGIFTMKAMIVMVHHIFVMRIDIVELLLKIMEDEWFLLRIIISLISKGREAVMVYIIKYMPACKRSG